MPTLDATYSRSADLSRSFRQRARHELDVPIAGIHVQAYGSENGIGLRRAVVTVLVDGDKGCLTDQRQASIVALVKAAAEGRVRGKPQIMITRLDRRGRWLSNDFTSPAIKTSGEVLQGRAYIYN
jgi:hypothetical protein